MPEFIMYIRGDKIADTQKFWAVFRSLADGKYLVKIDAFKKRSLSQNAYYWGVCVPMVKNGLINAGFGEVKANEDAHEVLKHLFLKKNIVNENTGEVITTITRSTSELKTVEFNLFLEDVWQWAAEYLNITIPAPNEQLVMFASYDNDTKAMIIE